MRPLSATEKSVIRWFAERVKESQRQSLLSDLEKATAEQIHDDQLTVRFEIEGYIRPPYRFERPFPVDAAVRDADGATLAVVLAADENERLFELQVVRFEKGPVLGPDWTTLRQLGLGEVVRLNQPPD
jgi:hypothetical protein